MNETGRKILVGMVEMANKAIPISSGKGDAINMHPKTGKKSFFTAPGILELNQIIISSFESVSTSELKECLIILKITRSENNAPIPASKPAIKMF